MQPPLEGNPERRLRYVYLSCVGALYLPLITLPSTSRRIWRPAAVVAFFCRIAANKADSSASDQWMQAIENVRREAAKREAR